ncbi:MAG: type II secretion system F family protein [Candidatus Aenigmatarchaeota archaeon]
MSSNPFRSSFLERLVQAAKTDNTAAAANTLFGPTVDKYSENFEDLKEDIKKANMDILYRTYVSQIFLFSSFAGLVGAIGGLAYSYNAGLGLVESLQFVIGMPVALTLIVFGGMYMYPGQKASSRRKNIDDNLPFALNHLGAIATSGIPPTSMFELLDSFEEYGGISEEAGEISRRVNVFGEDLTTALREMAERSPSDDWSEVLYGIISTVETGGDLKSYLQEKADEALFEYNMTREKEIEKLSTYASFYTAILIAAPVFLVVILAVMNLLGGQIGGFAIRDLMWLGVHVVIPVINALFVAFLALTVD